MRRTKLGYGTYRLRHVRNLVGIVGLTVQGGDGQRKKIVSACFIAQQSHATVRATTYWQRIINT